jgi:lipopolysaccharide transport system permease protein
MPSGSMVAWVRQFLASALRHRALVGELVLRDIKGSHAGHGLGSLWAYAQPLVVVVTYMLIFGVVIGSKIAVTSTFPGDYISYVIIGLTPWLVMANALGRAPGIFISNANLVKQVVFPIEVLPVASALACFLTMVPALVAMVVYKLVWGGGLTVYALLLPLVIGLHGMLVLGLMLLLSVVTPFIRDIREVVTIYSTISMYFTPAVYLPDWVPEAIRPMLYLNPFSYVIWGYQDVLFFGEIRHPFAWIVLAVMAVVAFLGGLMIFCKIRPYLGNVL